MTKMRIVCGVLLGMFAFAGSLLAQAGPESFAYVLQTDSLAKTRTEAVQKLARCGRDWIVIDASYGGGERWLKEDVAAIRAGKPGRKVVAYLSIGEAEDYRDYWRKEWKPGTPGFLLTENPEWKGNYRVKYWDAEWQKIILAEVDRIMAQGFDGVYLDIVDGFETFERDGKKYVDDRVNPATNQSYRRDMVDWVKVAAARVRKANAAALVIPQNGTQLLANKDFLDVADAVGVEDLFMDGDKPRHVEEIKEILKNLEPLTMAHKPVLDIEYSQRQQRQADVSVAAASSSFVWLVTDRELKTLGESGISK